MKLILQRYTAPKNQDVFDHESKTAFTFAKIALICQFVSGFTEGFGVIMFINEVIPVYQVAKNIWFQHVLHYISIGARLIVAVSLAIVIAKALETFIFMGLEYVSLSWGKKKKSKHFSPKLTWMVTIIVVALLGLSFGVSKRISELSFQKWIVEMLQKKNNKNLEDLVGQKKFAELKTGIDSTKNDESTKITKQYESMIENINIGLASQIEAGKQEIKYWEDREKRTGQIYARKKTLAFNAMADARKEANQQILDLKKQMKNEIDLSIQDEQRLIQTYAAMQDTLAATKVGSYVGTITISKEWADTFAKYFAWFAGGCSLLAVPAWIFFFAFLIRAEMEPKVVVTKDFYEANPFEEYWFMWRLKFSRALRNFARKRIKKIADLDEFPKNLFLTGKHKTQMEQIAFGARQQQLLKDFFDQIENGELSNDGKMLKDLLNDNETPREPSPPKGQKKDDNETKMKTVSAFGKSINVYFDNKGRPYIIHKHSQGSTKKYKREVSKELSTIKGRVMKKEKEFSKLQNIYSQSKLFDDGEKMKKSGGQLKELNDKLTLFDAYKEALSMF